MRKIAFVIHAEGVGLHILRKTSRLCVECDLLIVHRDELDPLVVAALRDQGLRSDDADYLVLGTIEPAVWRRGLQGGISFDGLVQYMADIKTYVKIEYRPGGWHPRAPSAG